MGTRATLYPRHRSGSTDCRVEGRTAARTWHLPEGWADMLAPTGEILVISSRASCAIDKVGDVHVVLRTAPTVSATRHVALALHKLIGWGLAVVMILAKGALN